MKGGGQEGGRKEPILMLSLLSCCLFTHFRNYDNAVQSMSNVSSCQCSSCLCLVGLCTGKYSYKEEGVCHVSKTDNLMRKFGKMRTARQLLLNASIIICREKHERLRSTLAGEQNRLY